MTFTHLRACSAYSLKYGTTQPRDLVARASEYAMPALALTDRDGLAGAIRFAQSCVEYGVAPIIGIDLAVDLGVSTSNNLNNKTEKKLPRITLLAHSDGGWRSLCRLLTSVHTYKNPKTGLTRSGPPVLTLDFLQRFSEYSQNLHVLHGPESPIGAAIAAKRPDLALNLFLQTRELFADQAIECVSHLVPGDGPRSTAQMLCECVIARMDLSQIFWIRLVNSCL